MKMKFIYLLFLLVFIYTKLFSFEWYTPIAVIKEEFEMILEDINDPDSKDIKKASYTWSESNGKDYPSVSFLKTFEDNNLMLFVDFYKRSIKIYDLNNGLLAIYNFGKGRPANIYNLITKATPKLHIINYDIKLTQISNIIKELVLSNDGSLQIGNNHKIFLKNNETETYSVKEKQFQRLDQLLYCPSTIFTNLNNQIILSKRENVFYDTAYVKIPPFGNTNQNPRYPIQSAKNMNTPQLFRIFRVQRKIFQSANLIQVKGWPVIAHGKTYILTANGLLEENGKPVSAQKPEVKPVNFIFNKSFFLITSNQTFLYNRDFKPLTNITFKNRLINACMKAKSGLALELIQTNSDTEWVLIDDKGQIKQKSPVLSGILNDYALAGIKKFSPKRNAPYTPFISVVNGGNTVQEWKYGEKDRVKSTRLLNMDEEQNLYIEVKLFDSDSGKDKTELLKFGSSGKFLNRIEAPADARFAVGDKGEIASVEGGTVKKYSYEPMLLSTIAKQSAEKIGKYLSEKTYTGDKLVYTQKDLALPEGLRENLDDINLDWKGLLKSEILARNGEVFKDPIYEMVFSNASWYKPKQGENKLNDLEKANIELLRE